MRCLQPRTVGFKSDGKTIAWSQKSYDKQYPTFQLPCGKCIKCRLEYARQWAVRCIHEARMHGKNSFITLTYSDEHLASPKLQYEDFQLFIKKLRNTQAEPISYFVTGEYGEQRKRPHWHAILFNYRPGDCKFKYSNDRGDHVYSSLHLDKLWGNGITEIGSVTIHSAGYCARYAAKKLVHGKDGHEYEPISKKSSKHAIGKKFLETYWKDIFDYGHVILADGIKTQIPRYYEKWMLKHHPTEYLDYLTRIKQERMNRAEYAQYKDSVEQYNVNIERRNNGKFTNQITKAETEAIIQEEAFKRLNSHLKDF
jgi:hypothetical protein